MDWTVGDWAGFYHHGIWRDGKITAINGEMVCVGCVYTHHSNLRTSR